MTTSNNPLRIALGLAFVLVFGTLLALLPWLRPPARDAERLTYLNGLEFTKGPDGFATVKWDGGDGDPPAPCPLEVHVNGKTYDAAALASPDRLRRDGWEERVLERTEGTEARRALASPDGVLLCSYRNGRLTNATATARPAGPPVAVSVKGRRVDLPGTREALIEAFGRPPRGS